jgi:uncharacterized membrane protein
MDQRAQTNGIISFFAIIAVSVLLFILFQPAVDAVLDGMLATTSNSQAETVIEQRRELFGYLLVYGLFLASLLLIARSVFQSRTPG